ncbi:MAG: hypothetical protein PWR10_992 [Halanaerobiales bacterium]|nr:hypothetical protein [Halanaerobiales bacterium]
MVARMTLDHVVQVRILVPQPVLALSSSGLGRRPLTPVAGVQIPLGLPYIKQPAEKSAGFFYDNITVYKIILMNVIFFYHLNTGFNHGLRIFFTTIFNYFI